MKIAIPVLTAAAFALFAGPAFAGHSTAKEREVTRQLNIQAAEEARASNQQSASISTNANPQTPAAPAAAPTTPVENAPPADQPAAPADPANPAAPAQAQ